MKTHEFQAKYILEKYGIKIPPFRVVTTLEEAKKAIENLSLDEAVIKVQIHAGGRGKAGGVKIAKDPDSILNHVKNMLGMKIVNNQTGPQGVYAHYLMISELSEIEKEYYVGIIVDRKKAAASLIISPEGGMEIEEIAEKSPDKIRTFKINNDGTLRNYQLVQISKFMGWKGNIAEQGKKMIVQLAKAFIELDAELLEINPLIVTPAGDMIALDAKLSLDNNAIYRHPDLALFYDKTQIPENEARAIEHDLAYISLDGEIGCMVNGAGLAMATMDIIQHYGGKPANFLDVGGSADVEKVTEGFKIILSDQNVKAVLVNIFGGIMNCATIGEAVVSAVRELGLKVPLVVRMEGTNVEEGKRILSDAKLNIIVASDLSDAAKRVVEASKESNGNINR